MDEIILSGTIASPHPAKHDRIQQLQQQIEAWQALLEKLGGNGAIRLTAYFASGTHHTTGNCTPPTAFRLRRDR